MYRACDKSSAIGRGVKTILIRLARPSNKLCTKCRALNRVPEQSGETDGETPFIDRVPCRPAASSASEGQSRYGKYFKYEIHAFTWISRRSSSFCQHRQRNPDLHNLFASLFSLAPSKNSRPSASVPHSNQRVVKRSIKCFSIQKPI